jgi:hypothetical protein
VESNKYKLYTIDIDGNWEYYGYRSRYISQAKMANKKRFFEIYYTLINQIIDLGALVEVNNDFSERPRFQIRATPEVAVKIAELPNVASIS